jgi:tetratricopeptide (TPR) repeat protein
MHAAPTAPVPAPVPELAQGGPARRWRAWLLLALVLPTAGWVLYESQRSFRAYWASAAEQQKVLAWVSGAGLPGTPQEWEDARAALQATLDLTPDDPDATERLGDLHAVAGQRDWADEALRRQHYARAVAHYLAAIQLRPSSPQSWAMLAAARQAMGDAPAAVHTAWDTAQRLGPFEGHVQPILMQVVLSDWDGASPAMQAWAKGLFDRGNESVRRDINALAKRYGLLFTPDPQAQP